MSGKIIHLTVVDSTNNYTSRLIGQSVIEHNTLVVAEYQDKGRGQREKRWQSESGENLLATLYWEFRPEEQWTQFSIVAKVSLAACRLLGEFGFDALIKWPNDVFINQKKVGGLLIENQLNGTEGVEVQSIIGFGLNVNQTLFDRFDWPATSLKLESGRSYDLRAMAGIWHATLSNCLTEKLEHSALMNNYCQKLMGLNEHCFITSASTAYSGILKGVAADGRLKLEVGGEELLFASAQIKSFSTSP